MFSHFRLLTQYHTPSCQTRYDIVYSFSIFNATSTMCWVLGLVPWLHINLFSKLHPIPAPFRQQSKKLMQKSCHYKTCLSGMSILALFIIRVKNTFVTLGLKDTPNHLISSSSLNPSNTPQDWQNIYPYSLVVILILRIMLFPSASSKVR